MHSTQRRTDNGCSLHGWLRFLSGCKANTKY